MYPNFDKYINRPLHVQSNTIVFGRAIELVINLSEDVWVSHFNLHIHGLSRLERERIASAIRALLAAATCSPSAPFVIIA
eukprot:9449100-Pyramimonas_sp.AAC.1